MMNKYILLNMLRICQKFITQTGNFNKFFKFRLYLYECRFVYKIDKERFKKQDLNVFYR